MLVEESVWIKKSIENHFGAGDFPLLNIGSSTKEFREKAQPHIYQNIFAPLNVKKNPVIHADMKNDEGVDVVGDLNDEKFRESLKQKKIKSVVCSNLLEHLSAPQLICNSILDLLPSGGWIIVTVPYSFPYHKDPIDTMLRPSISELHAFFPNTLLVESEIVVSTNSYKDDLVNNKKYLFLMMRRWVLPFYKFKEWKYMVSDLFRANRKYSATCLLLKKI